MNGDVAIRNKIKLLQVQQYIMTNLHADLSAANVAAHFSMSVSSLFHLFSKQSAGTYKEFVIDTRMKKALELLNSTNLSVKEILAHTGYNDRSSFNKCFKKKFLKPPLHFRK
ncbi:MAG: Transcriptional regulator, AraC family [Chitinophagaceae bacterium]|nr:Transcriptional regulator, AraC family [Chitinophagaceae bacterium]